MGVSFYNNFEVTLADIPGLVEGAHKGIGLGDKFLRHIERCKSLLHILDITENNLFENYKKVRMELAAYDKKLIKKKELIFLNKSDLVEKEKIEKKLKIFKSKVKKNFEVISVFNQNDIINIKKTLIKHAS